MKLVPENLSELTFRGIFLSTNHKALVLLIVLYSDTLNWLFFGGGIFALATHSSTLAWKIPWMEEPGSLVGCSARGPEKSDTTERLHSHFSLSCIGEGNDSPLQCSCLENPRDRGAWWATVYGVARSRTRLKRLSNSSIVALQCCVSFCCMKEISYVYTYFPSLLNLPPTSLGHHRAPN